MHHRVAMRDIDVELVERVAAQPLEVFLDLHLDVVACQIDAQAVAVGPEFVGNGREEDADRHANPLPEQCGSISWLTGASTLPSSRKVTSQVAWPLSARMERRFQKRTAFFAWWRSRTAFPRELRS